MAYPLTPLLLAASATLRREVHAHRQLVFNLAAGFTLTLPAAVGTGDRYEFDVAITLTGNGIVRVANSTDVIQGIALITGATNNQFASLAASDTITMNGSTTGGLIGSRFCLVDAKSGLWVLDSCKLVGSGTPATPFSATV